MDIVNIIISWLLTCIYCKLKNKLETNSEKLLSFLWLNLHSHSFKCKMNLSSVKPLNLASLLWA